jgi:leader peptidase (prepilin peptidase)/N-methyltransferase
VYWDEVRIFFGVAGFLFGITFGSFLNVLVWRLPRGESIVFPGSHCPRCNAPIHWYDNIPLLSYALLLGRCRACGERISPRYPLVELVSGLFLGAYILRFRWDVGLVYYAFTAALLVVTLIDLEHKIIPDVISLPGIPLMLLANMFVVAPYWPIGLIDGGIGILLGGGALLAVALGYYLLTHREGMGLGDPKLMAMIGALCGWKGVVFTMLVSSFTGTIVGVIYVVAAGKDRRFPIPFGPFLSLGAVAYLWVGQAAIRWYLGS